MLAPRCLDLSFVCCVLPGGGGALETLLLHIDSLVLADFITVTRPFNPRRCMNPSAASPASFGQTLITSPVRLYFFPLFTVCTALTESLSMLPAQVLAPS
jgi:hypothetical protein